MGIIQYWHILMYPLRFSTSQHWSAHIKSETSEDGSMGRQWNWTYERGGQLQSTAKIRTTCTCLLSTTYRTWSTVSTKCIILIWTEHSISWFFASRIFSSREKQFISARKKRQWDVYRNMLLISWHNISDTFKVYIRYSRNTIQRKKLLLNQTD